MRRLASLGWVFLWVSSMTLGGGMAMLPLLERELVTRRRWLTSDELVETIAVVQSLPGLIAINMAVLVGYRVRGVAGALVASVAVTLTPFLLVALIAGTLASLSDSPTLNHVFLGVRAGTAALILLSLARLARAALDGPFAWTLAALAFLAAVVLQVDLTLVVLIGFAAGLALAVARALGRARRS